MMIYDYEVSKWTRDKSTTRYGYENMTNPNEAGHEDMMI